MKNKNDSIAEINYNILVCLPKAEENTDLYNRAHQIFDAIKLYNDFWPDSPVRLNVKEFNDQTIKEANNIGIVSFSDNIDYESLNSYNLPVLAIAAGYLKFKNVFRWYYPIETIGFSVGKFIKYSLRHYDKYYISYVNYDIGKIYKDSIIGSCSDITFEEIPFELERTWKDYFYDVRNDLENQKKVVLTIMGHGANYKKNIEYLLQLKEKYKEKLVIVVESNYTVLYNDYNFRSGNKTIDYCITGTIIYDENIFVQFSKESIPLFYKYIYKFLDSHNISQDIINSLKECKYFETKTLGSIHYREDGELFLPLYVYDGKLRYKGNLDNYIAYCHNNSKELLVDEMRKIADISTPLSSLSVPRDLKFEDGSNVKKVLKECSETIASFSDAIMLDYISKYAGTKTNFYQWAKDDNSYLSNKKDIYQYIEALLNKSLNNPIQINLTECDLEDNDAQRVYVFLDDGLPKTVNELRLENITSVKSIIFAKSSTLAKTQYELKDYEKEANSKELNEQKKALFKIIQKDYIKEAISKESNEQGKAFFIYFIPDGDAISDGNKDCNNGGLLMVTSSKLSMFDLKILSNMVSRIFYLLKISLSRHDERKANIKSAIGSIMSRNGSHNIGSHVLTALSENVGTMPDDRVLYKYIQQRMDYIATATTEFPVWRQPTMLVSGMLREFLIQRHLLDHIAGSEKLRAYQFQNRSLPPNQHKTIRIHIRRINDDVSDWENQSFLKIGKEGLVNENDVVSFINYGKAEDNFSALKANKDVAVAIPGGVVGQHAFYTIIENIIRNAAKHDWAKIIKKDNDSAEQNKQNDEYENANLELFIDFKDIPKQGIVEFRIWTCVCKENDGLKFFHVKDSDEKRIINDLKEKICQSFIDDNGGLRKENWGIAEMRISAGYLCNSDIADIGGLNNNGKEYETCPTLKIIRPTKIFLPDQTSAFGYRFNLFKPKELLIVLPSNCNPEDDVLNKANKNANQYGIWLIKEDELKKNNKLDLSFSFVLFDSLDLKNEYCQYLPFRKIATNIIAEEGKDSKFQADLEAVKRLIPEIGHPIFNYINFSDVLKLAKDNETAKTLCESLLNKVYEIWISHLTKGKFPSLAIDIDGGGNEKKTLVTKLDLLKFVLENSFNAAAKAFLATRSHASLEKKPQKEKVVSNTEKKEPVENSYYFNTVLNDFINFKPREVLSTSKDESPSDFLRKQLKDWFRKIYGSTKGALNRYNKFALTPDYTEFINYICVPILGQAEAFLAKYEEDYSTLPSDFKIKVDDSEENNEDLPKILIGEHKISIKYTNDEDKRNTFFNDGYLSYFRHHDGISGDICNYLEPLSGSQSYLGNFLALRDSLCKKNITINDKRFVTSLIENALIRILIIDERVKKFMINHDEFRNKLGGLGIAVKDGDDKEIFDLFETVNSDGNEEKLNSIFDISINGVKFKEFEIIIIHQGIIDKLLDEHEKISEVNKFLKILVNHMRYVIVTTGRGTPSNIPNEARVLPYSVIKDTLLKCYPEKMILVAAVMNVLPIRNIKTITN